MGTASPRQEGLAMERLAACKPSLLHVQVNTIHSSQLTNVRECCSILGSGTLDSSVDIRSPICRAQKIQTGHAKTRLLEVQVALKPALRYNS